MYCLGADSAISVTHCLWTVKCVSKKEVAVMQGARKLSTVLKVFILYIIFIFCVYICIVAYLCCLYCFPDVNMRIRAEYQASIPEFVPSNTALCYLILTRPESTGHKIFLL